MPQHRQRAPILPLVTFLILSVVFYCVGYWLIFRLERASPLMMSVGVAAIATCLLHRRKLSSLGFSWGANRYHWISFLIPIGIATSSYLIIWGMGFAEINSGFVSETKEVYNLPHWNGFSIVLFHIFLTGTFTLLLSIPSILGEEIAWRGFLVPELSKSMSFGGVVLVSGLLWSVFHWPLIFKGFYGSSHTPLFFQLTFFSLFIISNSVTMTYLRYKTNSVWSAVIFHASSNIFIQKIFTPLTIVNDNSAWYIDEFGMIVPIVAFLVAIYYWNKAKTEFN